jgi:hypothetical protein
MLAVTVTICAVLEIIILFSALGLLSRTVNVLVSIAEAQRKRNEWFGISEKGQTNGAR